MLKSISPIKMENAQCGNKAEDTSFDTDASDCSYFNMISWAGHKFGNHCSPESDKFSSKTASPTSDEHPSAGNSVNNTRKDLFNSDLTARSTLASRTGDDSADSFVARSFCNSNGSNDNIDCFVFMTDPTFKSNVDAQMFCKCLIIVGLFSFLSY